MTENINGFYAIYLTGKTAQGFAMAVLRNGVVTGVDLSGVKLDGTYIGTPDNYHQMTITVDTPPNIPSFKAASHHLPETTTS